MSDVNKAETGLSEWTRRDVLRRLGVALVAAGSLDSVAAQETPSPWKP